MNTIGNILIGCTVCFLFLAGCTPEVQPETTETGTAEDKIIAEKVALAAEAQQVYVRLVAENKAALARKRQSIATDEIDVDFIGPPTELLQVIANRYGYKYVETGKKTRLKNINVRVKKKLPIDVLANIGYQIDHGADVVLDQNATVIRLIYREKKSKG